MFQQQQQPPPPQQFTHRKPIIPSTVASQNEAQAKEKLAGYVYEYLIHSGAPKAADTFKNEILSAMNLSQLNVTPAESPGFLVNWWSVFWDLYAATPERRDKMESSAEAKAFHEFGFIPSSTFNPGHMINGVHPNPQFGNGGAPPMGIPPNELPNYFRNNPSQGPAANQSSPIAGGPRYSGNANATAGTRSGAPTPSNVMGAGATNGPPNFPGAAAPMFNEQMRNMVQAQQRINPNGPRMNFNPAAMRQMRPGAFPGGFIDSPTGTPPFSQNPGMMPNGMCGLISSPGSQLNNGGVVGAGAGPMGSGGPPTSDGTQHDPRFMMMGGNMSGQFSMGGHHEGAGTPTSCPPGNNAAHFGNAPMHAGGGNPGENPSVSSVGSLQNLLNGGGNGTGAGNNANNEMDMKQSPSSHMNGGTPSGGMSQMNPGSIQQQPQQPASVHGCHGDPGSVHSQQGGAMGSVVGAGGPSSQQTYQTPTSEAAQSSMDFQHSVPTGNHGCDEEQEISKIKQNLIEGFESGAFS